MELFRLSLDDLFDWSELVDLCRLVLEPVEEGFEGFYSHPTFTQPVRLSFEVEGRKFIIGVTPKNDEGISEPYQLNCKLEETYTLHLGEVLSDGKVEDLEKISMPICPQEHILDGLINLINLIKGCIMGN